jgi:hypothetical protein
VAARLQRRIRRTRRGDYRIRIPPHERALLRALPRELRAVLESDDPAVERLFPPAYPEDPEREAEFRGLVREDLLARRLSAIQVMEETVDADRLDEQQLAAWVSAINDLRLVLGTRLGVTEDLDPGAVRDDDPRAKAFALYFYLTWLEEQAVEELSVGLGSGGPS